MHMHVIIWRKHFLIVFVQMKVSWTPEHVEIIRKNFHSKAPHRLSKMLMHARKTQKKPSWMFDDVWDSMLSKWNSATYHAKCSQVQQNRASETGGSLHIGGSISRFEHAICMVSTLNTNCLFFSILITT